jgi:hypothetical protein
VAEGQMDRHVYAVYSAGEKWNMALNGNVIGTFARPRDALKVAFFARVSLVGSVMRLKF